MFDCQSRDPVNPTVKKGKNDVQIRFGHFPSGALPPRVFATVRDSLDEGRRPTDDPIGHRGAQEAFGYGGRNQCGRILGTSRNQEPSGCRFQGGSFRNERLRNGRRMPGAHRDRPDFISKSASSHTDETYRQRWFFGIFDNQRP